jgi:tRNA 2-selenouridine synthase SelU
MDLNEKELDKLGDALEELTKSVMQKKMENALDTFKILKENKYSVFIEANKDINKDNYNEVQLENKVELNLSLKK